MIRKRIAVLILVCCLMFGAWLIPNSQAAVFSPTINPSLWETVSDWMHPTQLLAEKVFAAPGLNRHGLAGQHSRIGVSVEKETILDRFEKRVRAKQLLRISA